MKPLNNLAMKNATTVKGRVRCQVIDSKTGKVKRDYGWQKNLILNQGMDGIAVRSWAASFSHACRGTGTTPTQDDSGATQADQSGTTVTFTGGAFLLTDTATDGGKMIKWDSGEEARILTVAGGGASCTVANSATVAAGEFTVFRTNQTGMATEVSPRSASYVTGTGNNDTTYNAAAGTQVMKRTIDFPIEVGSVSYTEVGFSHTTTIAANLFSRILLGASIPLVADDQFRVIYELTLTLTYAAPQAITPTITGWGSTDGDQMIEHFGLHTVGTTGSTVANSSFVNDASEISGARMFLSNSTTALSSVPSTAANPPTNRNGSAFYAQSVTLVTYVPLSFTISKQVVILAANGVMADIRSISLVYWTGSGSTYYVNSAMLFDVNQVKLNTHTLTLTWVYTWTRVLA